VTSGGTAAINIRLVHRPCTINPARKMSPLGDHAVRAEATTNIASYTISIRRAGRWTANCSASTVPAVSLTH
jgi:hypothetical protein